MSDQVKDFEIKLVTTADLRAAQAAAGALKGVSQAAAEDGQATAAAARETGFLSLKKGELSKVVGQLGRQFPLAGQAARLMLNPMLAGATLAIGLFAKLREGIKQFEASLELTAWENYGKVTEAKREQFAAAAQGAAEFARQMERIKAATETASEASEKLLTVHKAQQSAQQKLDEAHQRYEEAQAGRITDPVARERKLLEIQERYAARERARQDAASRFEIEQSKTKLANEERAAAALAKQLEGAEARQRELKSEAEITAQLQVEKQRLNAIQEDYLKKSERLQDLQDKSWATRTTPEQQEMNILEQTTVPSLQKQLYLQRGIVAKLESQAPAGIEEWRKGQENIERLRGMQKGAVERAAGIRRMLPTQEAVAGIESWGRTEAGLYESASRAAGAAARGEAATRALVEQAARQVENAGTMAAGTEAALRRQADYNDAVNAYLTRLESQIKNLRNP
jgi:hypothetical protein